MREVQSKKLMENPFLPYPAALGISGNLDPIPAQSTCKKPTFGTAFIRRTRTDPIEKWLTKPLFLIVKS